MPTNPNQRLVGVVLRNPDYRFKHCVVPTSGKGCFTVLDSEPLGGIRIGDLVRFTPDGTYATALVFTDEQFE